MARGTAIRLESGRAAAIVINRSHYASDDLLSIVKDAAILYEAHCRSLGESKSPKQRYIVFGEWVGCPRLLKNGKDSREIDSILKIENLFDSATAGVASYVRLLRPSRDKYERGIVERIAGIERPAASPTVVDSIIIGVLTVFFGAGQRTNRLKEMDRLNCGQQRRVLIEPGRQPDDAAVLVEAFGQRFRGTSERNTDRAATYLRSMLRSLTSNDRKSGLVGGNPGGVEQAACERDPHLAFWLRVAREWEELAKTASPSRYKVAEVPRERPATRDNVSVAEIP